jgi:DNA topoisomerase-2
MKVAQLASSVAFETHYHHGEQGIGGVICNLAQDFAGSNNLNWLEPIGQFGSRLCPVPAATRYIFTKLSKNFRQYFKKEDDIILDHLYEDDDKIEPKFFIPTLPGVLLNSSQGIGTGFASNILARNEKELSNYINAKLTGKSISDFKLLPYFNGFKGSVKHIEDTKYQIQGSFQRVSATQIKITELPIGMYLEDAKKHLNKLIDGSFIKDYDDNSTEDSFDIDVFFQRGVLSTLDDDQLLDKMKLSTTITENLTCWLDTGKLRKFTDVRDIIDYFIEFRLNIYSKRIAKLLEIVEVDLKTVLNKIRFIEFYLSNVEKFRNASKLELLAILDDEDFDMSMLEMKIYNLTKDKIKELNDNLKSLVKTKKDLLKTTNTDLYLQELK